MAFPLIFRALMLYFSHLKQILVDQKHRAKGREGVWVALGMGVGLTIAGGTIAALGMANEPVPSLEECLCDSEAPPTSSAPLPSTSPLPSLPSSLSPLEIDSSEIDSPEVNSSEIDSPEVNPTEANSSKIDSPEVNPAEVNPAEANSSEVNSSEVNPAEANSSEVNPTEANSSEVNPAEANSSEIDSPEANPGKVNSPEINSPEINSPEVNSPEVNSPEIHTPNLATPSPTPSPPVVLDPQVIQQNLEKITVKIFGAQTWGSGFFLAENRGNYIILTNEHVVKSHQDLKLLTFDRQTYFLDRSQIQVIPNYDLAVIHLTIHPGTYPTPPLALDSASNLGLTPQGSVYAAGFPIDTQAGENSLLKITEGQVFMVADRALRGGYQVGYSNPIFKGMSGGPLMNDRGQIIGINGLHARPLWGDPYEYLDGSVPPCESLRNIMINLSWAIPITTALHQAQSLNSIALDFSANPVPGSPASRFLVASLPFPSPHGQYCSPSASGSTPATQKLRD